MKKKIIFKEKYKYWEDHYTMVRKRFNSYKPSWCHDEEVLLPEQVIRWLNS